MWGDRTTLCAMMSLSKTEMPRFCASATRFVCFSASVACSAAVSWGLEQLKSAAWRTFATYGKQVDVGNLLPRYKANLSLWLTTH